MMRITPEFELEKFAYGRIDPTVIRSVLEVVAATTRNSIQNCLRIEYLPENSRNLHTGISSELLVLQ